jgi:hypothetical protein
VTKEEAKKLCGLIPQSAFSVEVGYGRMENRQYADALRTAFPEHNWRIILDRSGERTRWALTTDDDDPREHYFDRLGGRCVHCDKSAREIARIGEVNGDDEFLDELATYLEKKRALPKRPRGQERRQDRFPGRLRQRPREHQRHRHPVRRHAGQRPLQRQHRPAARRAVVGACMCDCLHYDDVAALIVAAGLDKRPPGKLAKEPPAEAPNPALLAAYDEEQDSLAALAL